jgi:hypothetical protein
MGIVRLSTHSLVRTVSIGDDVRLLGRAASNHVEGKSNKLRMCPGQRCGRERTGARNETGLAGEVTGFKQDAMRSP